MPPELSSDFDSAFDTAVRRGWMSGNQYRYLADVFRSASNASLLVFGIGYDSLLWSHCVAGDLAFVEDQPIYLTLAPVSSSILLYEYSSSVGQWKDVPEAPALVDRPWDYLLVDGPAGFAPDKPGRQFPIAWAAQLATRRIFVHDYERSWERAVCDKILGQPAEVVVPKERDSGELAVFDCANLR